MDSKSCTLKCVCHLMLFFLFFVVLLVLFLSSFSVYGTDGEEYYTSVKTVEEYAMNDFDSNCVGFVFSSNVSYVVTVCSGLSDMGMASSCTFAVNVGVAVDTQMDVCLREWIKGQYLVNVEVEYETKVEEDVQLMLCADVAGNVSCSPVDLDGFVFMLYDDDNVSRSLMFSCEVCDVTAALYFAVRVFFAEEECVDYEGDADGNVAVVVEDEDYDMGYVVDSSNEVAGKPPSHE